MTSYQRLKEENKKLKRHIYMLVMKPTASETEMLRNRYQIQFTLSDLYWYGTPNKENISPNKNNNQ